MTTARSTPGDDGGAGLSDLAAFGHAVTHPTQVRPDPATDEDIDATATDPSRGLTRQRWTRPAIAAGVVALVTAVAIWISGDDGQSQRKLASTGDALLCAQDLRCHPVLLSATDGAAEAMALVRPSETVLLVAGLDANDRASEIYVLWQQDGSGSLAAIATFDVWPAARIVPLTIVDQPVAGRRLAISREPGRTAPAKPSRLLLTSS